MTALNIGLVGNPNCGKTTVFNALTGGRQRVGNWPGVTVECKTGKSVFQGKTCDVIDLPGVYSLTSYANAGALDERVACEFILSNKADIIVNVIDAANLERNLYLTTQLLELQVPMVVALNMMDVADRRGMRINPRALAKRLGCQVVLLQASKGKGIDVLKKAVDKCAREAKRPGAVFYGNELEASVACVESQIPSGVPEMRRRWFAVHLLEDDAVAQEKVCESIKPIVAQEQSRLKQVMGEDGDILFADARYQFIAGIIEVGLRKTPGKQTVSQRIDRVVLNRMWGIPLFLLMMYLMFFFSVNVGGAFQDFFDMGSDALFVQGLSSVLGAWHFPDWFVAIFGIGVGRGINTTVTFIPVIASMFLFLSLLEHSGYMTRAAFVVDRLMRALGLPGKSFVPMIVGFGCNVPAIMGTRTLDSQRDRILTVLMAPFMSCGARLAIYAVFTAAFFPHYGAVVVFSLYLVGILLAVLTGLMLRKTVLKGESSPLIMELPPYHLPTVRSMCMQTWHRLKGFVLKAGRFIVPVCVLMSALNTVDFNGHFVAPGESENSVLAGVGKAVTPVFAPMGIEQDNWPATVGLATGMLAKEVVIGTLNTLYADRAHIADTASTQSVMASLKQAAQSVPDNLSGLGASLMNPIAASAGTASVTTGVLGQLYRYFDGKAGAYAYLLFILLYIPCVSTIAAISRELDYNWAAFSVAWNTGVAYSLAVVFYQLATYGVHPVGALGWLLGFAAMYFGVISWMKSLGTGNLSVEVG